MPVYSPNFLNWRQYLNPLRMLSLWRIVTWLELSERGIFSSLQWFYRFMEKREPTLRSIKKRRLAAIDNLTWSIGIREDVLDEAKELGRQHRKKKEKERQAQKSAQHAALLAGQQPAPPEPDEEEDQEDDEGDEDGMVETPRLALAREQEQALKEAYEGIPNLRQAIRFLALAEFRGYAHLEKHFSNDGDVIRLEPVPQWNWARKMHTTEWLYNVNAMDANYGVEIDPANFIIRVAEDPIDETLATIFWRKNLGLKDWDGFQETYGIPSAFIKLPPGSTPADRELFQEVCERVISDMRGVLPDGADITTVDVAIRGKNPFSEHIEYQDAQIVLAGTGGKLTMLNDPVGIGGGQAEVHSQTFDAIAAAEGKEISEVLQEQFDAAFLDANFPGQEHLAFFRLSPVEVVDVDKVVQHTAVLKNAGWEVEHHQLEEKTGYELQKPKAPMPGLNPFGPKPSAVNGNGGNGNGKPNDAPKPSNELANRATDKQMLARSLRLIGQAQARDLAAVRGRLARIAGIEDEEMRNAKLRDLRSDLPNLLKAMNADPATEAAFYRSMSTAFFNGIAEGRKETHAQT